jgi:hypothetical protein
VQIQMKECELDCTNLHSSIFPKMFLESRNMDPRDRYSGKSAMDGFRSFRIISNSNAIYFIEIPKIFPFHLSQGHTRV